MIMEFPNDYPLKPPRCVFRPILPHPNVYPSGTICLSILNEEEDWKPSIDVKTILKGVFKFLKDEPNLKSPAQEEATQMYKNNRERYDEEARKFSKRQMKYF